MKEGDSFETGNVIANVKRYSSGLLANITDKKGSRIFGVGKYFHSKSTRPFLITKKGMGLEFLVLESISIPKVLGPF